MNDVKLFETFIESALYLWIHFVFLLFVCIFIKIEDTRIILWYIFILTYVFNSWFMFRIKRFFYLLKRVVYVLYKKLVSKKVVNRSLIKNSILTPKKQIIFDMCVIQFMSSNKIIFGREKFINTTYKYLLLYPCIWFKNEELNQRDFEMLLIYIMRILIKKQINTWKNLKRLILIKFYQKKKN